MNYEKLPEYCYTALRSNNKIVKLKRFESGYFEWTALAYPTYEEAKEVADLMNEHKGVDKFQAEAMENGSMFGWDVPGADPEYLKKSRIPV